MKVLYSWCITHISNKPVPYSVYIDAEMLEQMAIKADRSKTKRSKDGAIEVRIIQPR